jgi:hypothetical protein
MKVTAFEIGNESKKYAMMQAHPGAPARGNNVEAGAGERHGFATWMLRAGLPRDGGMQNCGLEGSLMHGEQTGKLSGNSSDVQRRAVGWACIEACVCPRKGTEEPGSPEPE